MFDIPSNDSIERVVITRDAVLRKAPPVVVQKTAARREKSA